MTATATEPLPASTADTWTQQLAQLKARYKHVREPILVALNILLHDQNIAIDGAKAQAALHGVKITAASISGARNLLAKRDGPQESATTPATASATPNATAAPTRRSRPHRAPEIAMDAEALIKQVAARSRTRATLRPSGCVTPCAKPSRR